MTHIENAVVFVTGANGGLGTEWVDQLLRRGASKIYASDITARDWSSEEVVPLHLDVTDQASIDSAARTASDCTILINNAGIALREPLTTVDAAALRRAFEIDFFGAVFMTQRFADILGGNGGGAIINVISVLSWIATTGGYSAAKAALWSATNSTRVELLHQRTQVLALHMGYVDTPMTANLDRPKLSVETVVRLALDGLEAGDHEVLADEVSHDVRRALSGPLINLYPQLQTQTRD